MRSGECFIIEPLTWYKQYNVESSLTFALGKVPAEQKAIADLSFESFQAAAAELKPDVPVVNAVKAAQAVIKPHGYSDNTNGTGHFIGLMNIERPPIEKDPGGVILKPGMVVSLHGNLIANATYKAIMGCCFLITDKGKEALTSLKIEPLVQL
jgi:Xaa-Pro aminopeptidase